MDVVSQALAENEHVAAFLRGLRESKVESIELGGCFGVSEQAMRRRATLPVRM